MVHWTQLFLEHLLGHHHHCIIHYIQVKLKRIDQRYFLNLHNSLRESCFIHLLNRPKMFIKDKGRFITLAIFSAISIINSYSIILNDLSSD